MWRGFQQISDRGRQNTWKERERKGQREERKKQKEMRIRRNQRNNKKKEKKCLSSDDFHPTSTMVHKKFYKYAQTCSDMPTHPVLRS